MRSREQHTTYVPTDPFASSVSTADNSAFSKPSGRNCTSSQQYIVDITNRPSKLNKNSLGVSQKENMFKPKPAQLEIKPFYERVQQAGLLIPTKAVESPIKPYLAEIEQHLREIELLYLPSPNFMIDQADLNGKMRAMLIDWLVDVHENFKLIDETLFLTVNIIDRFLSKVQVGKSNFQLIGVTALLIACKFEERQVPNLEKFVYVTEYAFNIKQLLQTERKMLDVLGFDLAWASPIRFLELYNEKTKIPTKGMMFCKFLLELLLLDCGISAVTPSLLAFSVLKISGKVNGFAVDDELLGEKTKWNSKGCNAYVCSSLDKLQVISLSAIRNKYRKKGIRL